MTTLKMLHGHCMTWNNATQEVEVSRCLFLYLDKRHMRDNNGYLYDVPTSLSGSELNRFTCGGYNRKGAQFRDCIDGYNYMNQLCFQIVSLVLTALNTGTTGFYTLLFS